MTRFHETVSARKLAYDQVAEQGVGVVFLGGFRSDMGGTKAVHLAEWAVTAGRPFLPTRQATLWMVTRPSPLPAAST